MNAYIPKKYQKICLENLKNMRNHGADRALVVMASGLGKTLTSAFDIREYLKTDPNGRVLMLCHSVGILSQAKDVFRDFFGDGYSYGMYNNDEKPAHRTDFLFANLQSVNLHKDEFDPDEFSYIVVDEAHHSSAETFRSAIEHFRPKFLLGMTATPDRMDNADIRDIFGEAIFDYPLWDAMKDGWLADVTYRVKTDEIQELEEILDSGKRFSLSQLNREVFVPKRDEEIARVIREETKDMDDPTMVIFCQTIRHAEEFARQMGDAVLIHSDMDPDECNRRLEGFRSGKIKTVCAVDMLNEGIDVPRTDVIVFLRVTQSKIVFTQQLGRGLRRMKGKGKVLVLDFVSTADRLEQLYQCEYEFKSATGRYPRREDSNDSSRHFTLDMERPVFRDRKVDILALIERAMKYTGAISDEALLEQLRQKADQLGQVPTRRQILADPEMASYGTYANRFGSWNEALKLAGLNAREKHFFSDEELLENLRQIAKELGRVPRCQDISDDQDSPCIGVYLKRYGNWNSALKAAGLGSSAKKVYSDDELLDFLRRKASELGRAPSAEEMRKDPEMPSSQVYRRRFGSWPDAVKAAGLEFIAVKTFTDDELIELLQHKALELGRAPFVSDFANNPNVPNHSVYYSRFGSWKNAIELAGLEYTAKSYTDEELLEQIRQKAEELGRTPALKDLIADPDTAGASTWLTRFGGWKNALELAGLEYTELTYSDEELLAQIRQKAEELGRTPKVSELAADPDMASGSTFNKRFGSYRNAVKLAGLECMRRSFSNEDLLAQIRRKAEELGRAPSLKELAADPDTADATTWRKRFGNYKNALELAGLA